MIFIFGRNKSSNAVDPHNRDGVIDDHTKKVSLRKKLITWFAFFKVDGHRRTERRVVLIGLFSGLLLLGTGFGLYNSHVYSIEQAQKVSVSNDSIAFSKTGAQLTLGKIQRSKDGTRAIIPFTISDMSNLSSNANNYSVFVETTSSSTPLTYKPTGRLLLFGTEAGLGTGAIVLTDAEHKIGNQSIYILLRNNKNITVNSNGTTSDLSDNTDLSAVTKKYDVAVMGVNPGASHAKVSNEIKTTSVSASNIYKVAFGNSTIKGINHRIKKTKSSLKKYIARVNADKTKLINLGLILPSDPDFMSDSYKPAANLASTSQPSLPSDSDVKYKDGTQLGQAPVAETTDSSGTTTQNADAESIWSDLLQSWQGVYKDKILLHNTYPTELKSAKQVIKQQDSHTSVSSNSGIHFKVIGKVKTN